MDCDGRRPRRASVAIACRAALIGTLASGAAWLIATTHLYATAVLTLLVAGLVTADLARLIERISHPLEPGAEALPAARLSRERSIENRRQIEHLQSLLDTVSAALVIVRPDHRILLANRAARRLAQQPVARLEQVAAIGPAAARALLSLPPGARSIVPFADGGRIFASISQFSSPEQERLRLLALQRIAGELDAVELGAWHEMAHVLAHEMMNSLTPIASLSESLERLLRHSLPADNADVPGRTHDSTQGGTQVSSPVSLHGRERSELLDALEAIRRRSTGLIDFVERYRAVAELPQPRTEAVRIEDVLGGVGRLLSARFTEAGIAYRASVEPAGLSVRADPRLLEQAVINLLGNAADAVSGVSAPRIEVTCRTRNELGAAELISIEVADNGCGIAADRRDRVFVPFFSTKAGGSGIGLSLARQIALAHGGRLELRPNQPAGSVFTLLVPAARADTDLDAMQPGAHSHRSASTGEARAARIAPQRALPVAPPTSTPSGL